MNPKSNSEPGKSKRPYKPPTIRTDKIYERRALACGKSSPNQLLCKAQGVRS